MSSWSSLGSLLVGLVILGMPIKLSVLGLWRSGSRGELGCHFQAARRRKRRNYPRWQHLISFYWQPWGPSHRTLFTGCSGFYTVDGQISSFPDRDGPESHLRRKHYSPWILWSLLISRPLRGIPCSEGGSALPREWRIRYLWGKIA